MIFYILCEVLLLGIIVWKKIKLFNIIPIFITLLFISYKQKKIIKIKKKLIFIIWIACLGDLAFINNFVTLGILCFYLGQLNYYFYLNDWHKNNIILFLTLFNILGCLVGQNKFLYIEAFWYFLFSLNNLIKAKKCFKVNNLLLISAFYCLAICDLSLALFFIFNKHAFYIIEWIAYILFQIFLVLFLI